MKPHRDERGILVSWLARTVIVLGLLGVALFDGGVIAVNFFRLDGVARDTAVELADLINDRTLSYTNVPSLELAAKEVARPEGARVVSVEAHEDGTVIVRLRREAPTIVVRRIDALRDWGRATATARANTP
jgi:hypothetical protein